MATRVGRTTARAVLRYMNGNTPHRVLPPLVTAVNDWRNLSQQQSMTTPSSTLSPSDSASVPPPPQPRFHRIEEAPHDVLSMRLHAAAEAGDAVEALKLLQRIQAARPDPAAGVHLLPHVSTYLNGPSEADFSCVIRALTSAGRLNEAIGVLRAMKIAGVTLRRRSFSALLTAFAEAPHCGHIAWRTYQEMLASVPNPPVAKDIVAAATAVARDHMTAEFLQAMEDLSMAVAQSDGMDHHAAMGLMDMFNKLGGYHTTIADVDSDGRFPDCPKQLKPMKLTEEELDSMLSQLRKKARLSKEMQQLDEWLRERGKFDVILDGPNVGHENQSWRHGAFSHLQIDRMVQHLRANGKRVLLVLSEKWLKPSTPLNLHLASAGYKDASSSGDEKGQPPSQEQQDAIRELIRNWQALDVLYPVRRGFYDDFHILYAAMTQGHGTWLVSNDNMRDHDKAFRVSPKLFSRWLAQHQIKFTFDTDLTPHFAAPTPFPPHMHFDPAQQAWFVPIAGQTDRWLVAWRSTSHDSSITIQ